MEEIVMVQNIKQNATTNVEQYLAKPEQLSGRVTKLQEKLGTSWIPR